MMRTACAVLLTRYNRCHSNGGVLGNGDFSQFKWFAGMSTDQSPAEVVIALGSNMDDRVGNLTGAIQSLRRKGVEMVLCSSLYESKAAYVVDQPDFLNAAVLARTSLSPLKLLEVLKHTEKEFGRNLESGIRFGPRPLDLDIIAYGTETRKEAPLIIPHERWGERDFVKAPVSDLARFDFHARHSTTDDSRTVKGFLKDVLSAWMNEGGDSRIGAKGLQRVTPLGGVSRSPGQQEKKVRTSGGETVVMGVLNVTPDSFSDGGKFFSMESALAQAKELISKGADIIDIGGQSTRPGATLLSPDEESERVVPLIKALAVDPITSDALISIDTFYSRVARDAVGEGAKIINDVSGGTLDDGMLNCVASLGVPYVCMHMRGTPQTMQSKEFTEYDNICLDVGRELQQRAESAMLAGIPAWNIILDPGIGFAKTHTGNLDLIRGLADLKDHGLLGTCRHMPILAGASRKGFLGSIVGKKKPEDRDVATAAVTVACVQGGAEIIRAHNVEFARDASRVADALYRGGR
ncbi:hypothetical protein BSKO_11277 [Bryopsis sp. KO-2023]|nr:hypothetical protein BSKO_11277 [Bryopsis sp. KO-2023]